MGNKVIEIGAKMNQAILKSGYDNSRSWPN
jgi:hypothetical protein